MTCNQTAEMTGRNQTGPFEPVGRGHFVDYSDCHSSWTEKNPPAGQSRTLHQVIKSTLYRTNKGEILKLTIGLSKINQKLIITVEVR